MQRIKDFIVAWFLLQVAVWFLFFLEWVIASALASRLHRTGDFGSAVIVIGLLALFLTPFTYDHE